ncbi:hypothetical protein BJ508DRAFT_199232, partial [Ascobolus immersus RN42]
IIPIIFGSDETPYTQLGGDKKGWPLFMSIGNIHSSIRNLLSSKAFIQLASLPAAPPLSAWIRQKNNSIQQTLSVILQDLSVLYSTGIEFNCSDGKVRIGHPKMCGWIADYKEFGTLFQIYANSCAVCEI